MNAMENLIQLASKWRIIRLHYPGWVVAPDRCREELWEYTVHWLDVIFMNLDSLAPLHAQFLLYELNWRLEVALCPLLLNQAHAISQVVQKVNALLDDAKASKDLKVDWNEIRAQTEGLSFAILRESREDLDAERFQYWSSFLLPRVKENADSLSKWHYEQCLFNLNSFNHRKVEESLAQWTPLAELPFWEAKRASILAELGQIEQAEQITQKALDLIRSRLKPFITDYNLLSQEGLVMMLLRAVRLQIRIQKRSPYLGEDTHYSLRWNQLEAYGCNPWTERRVLELALTAAPPRPPAQHEETESFDSERVILTTRYVSSSHFYDYRAGFAFLRYFEEGGIPLKCGTVDTSGGTIVQASKWIEPFAPLWSLASNIRAGKDDAIKTTFDRVRIATLKEKEVDTLYKLLMEAAPAAIQPLIAGDDIADISFGARLIPVICELLARIAFRLGFDRLDSLLNLGLRLYAIPQRSFTTHESLNSLFHWVIDAASPEQLQRWLPRLLTLPIPTDAGFEIHQFARSWPEPALFIEWKRIPLQLNQDTPWLTELFPNLIRIAEAGKEDARKRAILRLDGLLQLKLLTPAQKRRYARAMWARQNPQSGLPADIPFYEFGVLNLPAPNKSEAVGRLRQWLVSTNIPPVVHVTTSPQGTPQMTTSGGLSTAHFLHNLIGATKRMWDSGSSRSFLDWTTPEALKLLDNVLSWWDSEKRFLAKYPDVRHQLPEVITVVSEAVLPRLSKAGRAEIRKAERLFIELSEARFPALTLAPGLLGLGMNLPGVELQIVSEIRSNRPANVKDAIDAIFLWCGLSKTEKRRKSTEDLVHALISKILSLREPHLGLAIATMARLLSLTPLLISEADINMLDVALDHLKTETEMGVMDPDTMPYSQSGAISVSKRPRLRAAGARLAFAFWELLKARKIPISSSVSVWQSICQQDPLPEVRRAWGS